MKYFYNVPGQNPERHHMQNIKQIIEYFLPNTYEYIIVNDNEKSDITIYHTNMIDNSQLKDDEINILISVENLDYWGWYPHYNKYGNYNNNKIDIYLYNHIDTLIKNEKYISIPMIHKYINYYNLYKNILEPSNITPFNQKKFCLIINKSKLNKDIDNIIMKLNKINTIDNISMYSEINNLSCYHSIELLNVFNKYKFIICYENSYANGYITEKIFNCFFGKTIPIYKGSPLINKYIYNKSYLDGNSKNLIDDIIKIKDNENLFNEYINAQKISTYYNNENNNILLIDFIENKLKNV